VFRALFGAGPARDALTTLRARGGRVEIVFQSASPQFLGLPWELLRDPARGTPLALDGVAVSRSLPNASLSETFAASGDRLRVLMVISRPAGTDDVGYRMVARPLVERLDAVRGTVDLVVLRPPTIATPGRGTGSGGGRRASRFRWWCRRWFPPRGGLESTQARASSCNPRASQ
jgi:hypothetical protein